MTKQQHPITPPPELVMQWVSLACEYEGNETWIDLATQAARWGADQELEACCEYLTRCAAWEPEDVKEFCDNRRPKPPNLAKQALDTLKTKKLLCFDHPEGYDIIRRALERLQELENNG